MILNQDNICLFNIAFFLDYSYIQIHLFDKWRCSFRLLGHFSFRLNLYKGKATGTPDNFIFEIGPDQGHVKSANRANLWKFPHEKLKPKVLKINIYSILLRMKNVVKWITMLQEVDHYIEIHMLCTQQYMWRYILNICFYRINAAETQKCCSNIEIDALLSIRARHMLITAPFFCSAFLC